MINDINIQLIETELRNSNVHAITVNKTIQLIKNLQRHILQLKSQIRTSQDEWKKLRKASWEQR